jgi:HrpA-like RNA helicase
LDSESGDPLPPVLAVKLQELFGLADTPRIADGRVPLTLHLLSPAAARCRSPRTCATSGKTPTPK